MQVRIAFAGAEFTAFKSSASSQKRLLNVWQAIAGAERITYPLGFFRRYMRVQEDDAARQNEETFFG